MAKLYFYYSAMNAGKSTILLQSSYNYQERGMDTLLYTPMLDDRYGIGKITSRIGLAANAQTFESDTNLFEKTKALLEKNPNARCLLLDEAHFLNKKQVLELSQITIDLNVPVLAYGIRTDFRGEPFEGSLYLLSWADKLVEVKTICHCGSKATMVMRVDENNQKIHEGNQIEIGGNTRYVSVCRKHFVQDNAGPKIQVGMPEIEEYQI